MMFLVFIKSKAAYQNVGENSRGVVGCSSSITLAERAEEPQPMLSILWRRHRDVLKKWESDRCLPNSTGKSLQDPKPTKLKLRGRTRYEPVVCFPMKEPLLKLQTFETKKEDTVKQPF